MRPPTPQILDFGGGFWILGILDFGFWGFEILDFGDFGFWILGSLDFGFWGRNPKSKIQNLQSKLFWPNFLDFGFWILDRYVAILYVRPQRPIFWILAGILNFGFWKLGIQDFGDFGILGILDFGLWGFWILDFGGDFEFWILEVGDTGFWGFWDFGDFGFWIVGILDFGFLDFGDFGDFGFWIFGTLCSRSLCAKFGFWNLGILDCGFWGFWILGILDFGFWGSWILDFGLGILDGHLVTKFWMLHKKRRLCTPNRVGGFTYIYHININQMLVNMPVTWILCQIHQEI